MGVDVHVARGWELRVSAMAARVGVQRFPGHACLLSRGANVARSRSGGPYMALRLLGAQWNRLELLCPNLSKHCAQSRLF
jgi:hypothetical protein